MTTSNSRHSEFRVTAFAGLGASTVAKTTQPFQSHRRYRTAVTLLLALVLAYAGSFGTVRGATDPGPTLTSAEVTVETQATVTVTGTGFTSGGMVYVAIYDQWGASLFETRWVTASKTVYGLYGSRDPKAGYVLGGAISEEFVHLCGAATMVRAYDHQTVTWSNWIEADSTATGISNYFGATGSLDPAFGYRPSC